MMPTHKWYFILVIAVVLIFQVITMGVMLNSLDSFDIFKAWYNKRRPSSRGYFDIQYGPPMWLVDMMWPILFIYQLAWQCYGLSLVGRTTPNKSHYLYEKPYYMPLAMYVSYLVAMIIRISWASMISRCSQICTGLIAGSFVTTLIATVIAFWALHKAGLELYDMCMSLEVHLTRGLVHNGLAAYATWELLEFLVSIRGVAHHNGLSHRDSAVTSLGLLMLFLLAYAILDLWVFEIYSRFTVSPYCVLFFDSIGMTAEHWYSGSVSIMSLIIFFMTITCLIIKLLNIFARHKGEREPLKCKKSKKNFWMNAIGPRPMIPVPIQQPMPVVAGSSTSFVDLRPEVTPQFQMPQPSIIGVTPLPAPDFQMPGFNILPDPTPVSMSSTNVMVDPRASIDGLQVVDLAPPTTGQLQVVDPMPAPTAGLQFVDLAPPTTGQLQVVDPMPELTAGLQVVELAPPTTGQLQVVDPMALPTAGLQVVDSRPMSIGSQVFGPRIGTLDRLQMVDLF